MTDDMRTLVWNEKFFADMRQRYFGRLAARYRKLDNAIHIALLVLSGATFSSASDVLFPQHTAILALVATAVAATTTVMRLSDRSSSFTEFSVDWGKLHHEYTLLWNELRNSSVESGAVHGRVQELRSRAEIIDRRSTAYGTHRRLLLACHREAVEAIAP